MGNISQHSYYLLLPNNLSQDLMTPISSHFITLYLQVRKVGWGQLAVVLDQHGFANVSGLLVGAAGSLCSAGQCREGLHVDSPVGTSYTATQGSQRENV